MNSMAQHAVPNGIGQSEFARELFTAQSTRFSNFASRKFSLWTSPTRFIAPQPRQAESSSRVVERTRGTIGLCRRPLLDEVAPCRRAQPLGPLKCTACPHGHGP